MFYKKQGLPEDDSLVICTVKKILPNSVFVDLDEYANVEGMIYISEISPGRIRNLRDFVVENKKIVCKVLKVDKNTSQIDLSLRRVNLAQKKQKDLEYKQEQKAEKILENLARELKTDLKDIYTHIGDKLIEKYGSLYAAFLDIVNKNKNLKELEIKEDYRKSFLGLIKEKIKPAEVSISGTLELSCAKPDGIVVIKNAFGKANEIALAKKYKVDVKYISAPHYKITVTANEYKSAEKIMNELVGEILMQLKNAGGVCEFKR